MEEQRTLLRPDGIAIAYGITRAARRGADPLVLVHGLASNRTRWSEFVERTTLVRTHDVIRLDLRGHGESQVPLARLRPFQPVSLEAWADDIAAILAHEGHERAIVVGHSLGAQVALSFAGRHAARTRAQVLIDPVFRAALKEGLAWRARFGFAVQLAAWCVRIANALGASRRALPPFDLRALDELARESLRSKDAEQAFIRKYSSARNDLRYFHTVVYLQDLVELFRALPPLESMRHPVLVLLSTGATFIELDRARAVIARFPDAQTATIDCHHWPLTERPAEVRQAIERWCERLAPSG